MPQFAVTNFLGTKNFGPINVPQGLTGALFSMDGTNMTDPAMHGSLQMDISLDGGVTWASTNRGPETNPYPVIMEFVGGTKDKNGNPVARYDRACVFPHPELATRQLRSQLVVAGAPLTTTATLTPS
jgi:hypothetical protein